jgi:hypothetical protein
MALGPVSSRGQDLVAFPAPERIAEVARSPEWRRLLHYRSPFLRGARSDVDTEAFFLDGYGAKDPERELRATLAMLLDPAGAGARSRGGVDQPAACAFPARRDFLARAFGPELARSFAAVACPAFDEWSSGIAARAATLVFSSSYPNNPASMFGHTFLRLDRDPDSDAAGSSLRSYSVDFSATIGPDENPVKYAVWGLVGGYTGRFDLAPYYRKVNEYAYSESRDLWEYRLSLSEGDVARLVRHVWELYAAAGFDYFFLDENCSFRILTLLEAVRPDWELSRGFVLSAIPVETVKKVVAREGAVVATTYRPSLRNQMVSELDRLADDERSAPRAAFAAGNAEGLSTPAIDALIAALAYEKARKGADFGADRARFLRETLVERSRRGRSEAVQVPEPEGERPHLSHGSSLLSISGAARRGSPRALELGLYGVRHDFLDRTPSFNLFSEVRLLGTRVSHREGEGTRLEGFDLLSMASMAPRSAFDPQASWKVGLDWLRVPDGPGAGRGGWRASGGYGFGANVFNRRSLAYALAFGSLERSSSFRHRVRLSLGPDLGAILGLVPNRWSAQLRVLPLWDAWGAVPGARWRIGAELEQSLFLSPDIDLRFAARLDRALASGNGSRPGGEGRLGYRF